MTQEGKELLLKDLCTRLPYGVKIQVKDWATLDTELKIGHIQRLQNDDIELKPYLRSLSSMTEEEKEYIISLKYQPSAFEYMNIIMCSQEIIDWLNKKMLDYRGLIPLGLALEALEGMYETK